MAAKHAGQAISETALKQLAFDSVIDQLGYGLLRRNFIRFAMPFAETGVGIFLIVSGLLLDNLLTLTQDSPLVAFVKKSPFALNGSGETSSSEHALVTEFLAMLIQPQAKLTQLPNHASSSIHIRLTLQLPLFDIDHHRLHVVTSASTYQLPLAAMKAGVLAPPQAWHVEQNTQIKLQPVAQQTVFNQALGLSEVSFDYRLDATEMALKQGYLLEVNACFQLQLDEHTNLPLVKNSSYAPAAFYITIHAQWYCLPNERGFFIAKAAWPRLLFVLSVMQLSAVRMYYLYTFAPQNLHALIINKMLACVSRVNTKVTAHILK